MTPQQIELIKSTVPVLRENGETLTAYFYQRMLNHYPELKNTFNLDHQHSGKQARALAAAVLAYADNIENPSVLAKAVERITTKHVSLNIQPAQYSIVGEQLLLSISEVLNVAMDSALIEAWKTAYLQLADLLIQTEKQKYTALEAQVGGWAGWREFHLTAIENTENGKLLQFSPTDQAELVTAEENAFISVRVAVPEQQYLQPYQFNLQASSPVNYQIVISDALAAQSSVAKILSQMPTGTTVEISAPMHRS